MTSALVLLGFDVGHLVATLLNFKPSALVVAVATVDGSLDPRVSAAYSYFEQLATMSRVRCDRINVDVSNFEGAVETLREAIIRLSNESLPVIVDVGGGMRLLVLEALLAVLSLPNWLQDLVNVVVYLEGTNRYIELNYERIMRTVKTHKLRGRTEELTYIDRKILEILEGKGIATLKQIHEELMKQNISTSKQNVGRLLTKLEDKGYVKKVGRGRYMKATV